MYNVAILSILESSKACQLFFLSFTSVAVLINVPLQCQFPSKRTSFKHQMASEDAQGMKGNGDTGDAILVVPSHCENFSNAAWNNGVLAARCEFLIVLQGCVS